MARATILVHLLVILSMLTSGLQTWPEANQASEPPSAPLSGPTLDEFPTAPSAAPTYPEPGAELPAALPETPAADSPADEAELAAYILSAMPQDSPLLAASPPSEAALAAGRAASPTTRRRAHPGLPAHRAFSGSRLDAANAPAKNLRLGGRPQTV